MRSQSAKLIWIYNPDAKVYERNNNYVFNVHPKNCLICMCRTFSCICDDTNNSEDKYTHTDFRYKPIGIGIMPSRKKK